MSVIELSFESFFSYFRTSDDSSLVSFAKDIEYELYKKRKIVKEAKVVKKEAKLELPHQSAIGLMTSMGINPTDF